METRVSGVVSPEEALVAIAEAHDQVQDRAWYELVQHDEHALLDIDYVSGVEVVAQARVFLDSLREGAIAIVAEPDLSYGRCRQIQMRLESSAIAFEVFRKADEARVWLDEQRAQGGSSAPQPDLDLTIDVAPLFGCAQQSEQLVETWRVLRGEFEPRDEVERLAELPAMVEATRDRRQVP